MNIGKIIKVLKNRFGFLRKRGGNQKEKEEKDFFLPKDKKTIEKLSERESKLLQKAEQLDHKIIIIQNSTRTLIPQFAPLHHNLRSRFRWYYNWHLNPHAKKFHWVTLFLAIIFSAAIIYLSKSSVLAAGYGVTGQAQVLNTNSTLNFSGYNANVTISSTSGQFSGYVWSPDIGWIAFGTQDNPDGPVNFNPSTCMVLGKARVLNDGTTVDFNSAPYNSNVSIHSGNFSGYAWSNSIGWINFTGVSTSSDIFAPSSNITSPTNNTVVGAGTISIQGTAQDPSGTVANVQVNIPGAVSWANAQNTGTNFSTWQYSWSATTTGSYTIQSRATDNCGTTETPTAGITITIDATPPTKPENLKVYDISNRISGVYQVLLDWTASTDTPSGLKEYEVYRGTEKIGTTTESFYVDTKLKPASYPYSIRAVDKVGNISDSDQVKIDLVSKETLKPVISDISATPSKIVDKDERTTAMISWKTDKPSTSLVYYGLGGAKANQTELDTKLNTGHSVVLTDLKPQTTYHFSVSSKDIYGNQVDSQDMTFTTTPAPEKESILDLIIKTLQKAFEWFKKAMAASLLDKLGLIKTPEQVTTSILVFDVSNPDLQKYQALVKVVNKDNFILEKSTDGKSFAQLAQVSGKDYFLDQNLKNSQTYYYKVRGVDGVVSLRPAGLDPTPPTITDIKTKELAVTQDKVEVLLSFQTDKLTTSEVELDGKTLKDDNLNQSHNLFLEDLKPTQTYKYKIKAQTETGIETSSSEQTLTTSTPPPEKTVLQLIIEVLQRAFGGFVKWLKT
jgi:hypothetical protein